MRRSPRRRTGSPPGEAVRAFGPLTVVLVLVLAPRATLAQEASTNRPPPAVSADPAIPSWCHVSSVRPEVTHAICPGADRESVGTVMFSKATVADIADRALFNKLLSAGFGVGLGNRSRFASAGMRLSAAAASPSACPASVRMARAASAAARNAPVRRVSAGNTAASISA